jgi:hypothetical protein
LLSVLLSIFLLLDVILLPKRWPHLAVQIFACVLSAHTLSLVAALIFQPADPVRIRFCRLSMRILGLQIPVFKIDVMVALSKGACHVIETFNRR